MKAQKIEIEIGYNNELLFIVFKTEDVFKAIQEIQKKYKGCLIYNVKTQY